jgi:hypothetical protein
MRLSTPISKHLRNVKSWQEAGSLYRRAFRESMKGKAYGYDACRDAWEWFRIGFKWGAKIVSNQLYGKISK